MPGTDPYWSLDLVGLTEEVAERIDAASYPGVLTGIVVDPRMFLTLHMDADTIRPSADFLRGHDRDDVVECILQELDSWLDYHDRNESK